MVILLSEPCAASDKEKLWKVMVQRGRYWGKGGGSGETEKGQFSSLVLPSSLPLALTRALHIFSLKGKIRDYSQFTNKRVKNPNW